MRTLKKLRFLLLTAGLLMMVACPGPTSSSEEVVLVESVDFNFHQGENVLYFSVQVNPDAITGAVDSVSIDWYGTDTSEASDRFLLNDSGKTGDILKGDNIYSIKIQNTLQNINNVIAVNDSGYVFFKANVFHSGKDVQYAFEFQLGNLKPVILNVSAPDTLNKPTTGFALYLITCEVADANGLEDIRWVGFKSYHTQLDSFMNGGNYIYLYDDGGRQILYEPEITSGDSTVGDGIFSFQIPLTTSAITGTYSWIFEAQDMENEFSNSIVHQIVIQ